LRTRSYTNSYLQTHLALIGPNDYQYVTSYFQHLFFSQNKVPQKEIYLHLTHATVSTTSTIILPRNTLNNEGKWDIGYKTNAGDCLSCECYCTEDEPKKLGIDVKQENSLLR
jgi:hypothetical protein